MEAAFLKHEGYFGTCGALMGEETDDGLTPKSHIIPKSPKISGVPGPASSTKIHDAGQKRTFDPVHEQAPIGFCAFDLVLTIVVLFLQLFWHVVYHLNLLFKMGRPTERRLSKLLAGLERLQELRHKSLAEKELLDTIKNVVLDTKEKQSSL